MRVSVRESLCRYRAKHLKIRNLATLSLPPSGYAHQAVSKTMIDGINASTFTTR